MAVICFNNEGMLYWLLLIFSSYSKMEQESFCWNNISEGCGVLVKMFSCLGGNRQELTLSLCEFAKTYEAENLLVPTIFR